MNLEQEYKKILSKIKIEGIYRNDRTGVGSYSLFNQSLNWNLSSNKFPMFTGKKMKLDRWEATILLISFLVFNVYIILKEIE